MKEYGKNLKKKLTKTENKLNKIKEDISKRYDLIISDFSNYIVQDDKDFIVRNGASNLTLDDKLTIIINTEDNYVTSNGDQLDLFK
jgi:hypothetical protein